MSSARIQRDVKANGVRLRVHETGSGPSLLLLHGLFMDHSTWDQVGDALGGAVAITLAARHPELISKLVLVDALCYPPRLDLANRVALAPLIGGFAFKQLWGRSAFKSYFKDSYLSRDERIPSARLEHYYESFNAPAARASALATLRATRDTRSVVAYIGRI